jgi:hypothetical protein
LQGFMTSLKCSILWKHNILIHALCFCIMKVNTSHNI